MVDLAEGTKVEYEAAIRAALRASKSFQTDKRFSDLWKSITEGEQRRSSSRARSEAKSEPEDNEESDEVISPVKSARRALEAAPAVVNDALTRTTRAAPAVVNEAFTRTTRAMQHVQNEALALQRQVQSNELVIAAEERAEEYSNALVSFTEQSVVPFLRDAQNQMSNSWIIIATTLAIEVLFILSVTIPYNHKIHMQPWKWATFQLTPDHPWTVTLPDIAVIAQLSFARVMLVWMFASVILPLTASSLVVFPRPSSHKHLSEPSPLTYSIVRLATDVYLAKIAPAPMFGDWSASVFTRFGELQLLLASIAAAFSFYEVVASK